MSSTFVQVEKHGALRIVTMKRPPVNAIDVPFLEELERAFEPLATDDDVGAVVFTGSGSCFSAGLDLRQLASSRPDDLRRLILTLNRVLLGLFSLPRPLVAALNGHAIAGGLMLAMCCDFRVAASERCKVGLTEVRAGFTFPASGIEIARSGFDPPTLHYLAQIGRNIDSAEAHRRGIVDELVDADAVFARAVAVAEDLASVPRGAYVGTKQQLRGEAISRIQHWVDANDDPAMPIWTDPSIQRTAAALLEGRHSN